VETWRENLIDDDAGLRRILLEARTIAVLGAKDSPGAPAFEVPAYLAVQGYRTLPVNPYLEGRMVHGVAATDRVGLIGEPVDVIEVFRAPRHLPAHAEEVLSMPTPPSVVWFQLGIRNPIAAERLARAGLRVVQDRCMMPEHRRLAGTRRRTG
jgi:predicted CoA-binding protein